MAYLKFQHVFGGLMALSAVTAFVIPSRFIQPNAPAVEVLFAPVARPAGAISRWARDKFAPPLSTDRRADNQVKIENQVLRDEVSSLSMQLTELKAAEGERIKIGAIRRLCTPYAVVGVDAGARESLAIQGSRLQGLRDGMYVLYPGGIVGQVQRSGLAGARVRLVTDEGFRVRVSFARYVKGQLVNLNAPQTVIEGVGRNTMVIRGLTKDLSAGLQVGDAVILNEPDWPDKLQGRHLGRITWIGDRPGAPGYAQITVEPAQSLTRLREVMVLNREE